MDRLRFSKSAFIAFIHSSKIIQALSGINIDDSNGILPRENERNISKRVSLLPNLRHAVRSDRFYTES